MLVQDLFETLVEGRDAPLYHATSVSGCEPRVDQWVKEFLSEISLAGDMNIPVNDNRNVIKESVQRVAVWSGATIPVLENPTRAQFESFAKKHPRHIRGCLSYDGQHVWLWNGGQAVHPNIMQELGLSHVDCIHYIDGRWHGPVHEDYGYKPAIERLTPTPTPKYDQDEIDQLLRDLGESKEPLKELRRNPEVNKMPTIYDQLKVYRGQSDVFVSFVEDVGRKSHPVDWSDRMRQKSSNTHGTKLGINPRSEWRIAPLGIFGYPIDYVLDKQRNVPFGGGRPLLYVFRAKNLLNLNTYTLENLENDVKKLQDMFDDVPNSFGGQNPARGLLLVTKSIAEKLNFRNPPAQWNGVLRKLGYSGLVDFGNRVITGDLPYQAVVFSIKAIEPLKVLNNSNDWMLDKVGRRNRHKRLEYDSLYRGFDESASSGTTGAASVATAIGGLGAGFDPKGDWGIYQSKKKKKKPLVIRRQQISEKIENQVLDEINLIPDFDDNLNADRRTNWTSNWAVPKTVKKVGKIGEYNLCKNLTSEYETDVYYLLDSKKNPMGKATVVKKNDFYRVSHIWFDPTIRGKGYGFKFYEYLLNTGITIISDDSQTRYSKGVWQKLAKKYTVRPFYKSKTIDSDRIMGDPIKDISTFYGDNNYDLLIAMKSPNMVTEENASLSFLYHGTSKSNLQSIIRNGLTPYPPSGGDPWPEYDEDDDDDEMPDEAFEARVFATQSRSQAKQYAENYQDPIILRINEDDNNWNIGETDFPYYYTTEIVLPSSLQVFTKDGWKPLINLR